jgi:hypothetical protein
VGVVVVVKSRRVGEDRAALEDGHEAICLLGGGEDAECAFAAGNGDALAL